MIIDVKHIRTIDATERLRAVLADATELILYHGTSSTFHDSILQNGLTCRGINGNSTYKNNFDALESNPELVYLGSFLRASTLGSNVLRKSGGELRIYRVRTQIAELLPDEDSLKPTALESLTRDATCAKQGGIPVSSILGYYTVEHRERSHGGKYFSHNRYHPLHEEPKIDRFIDERSPRRTLAQKIRAHLK